MTYEQENSFAGYDPSGITPEDLLARLIALQSKIASTVSEVRREDNALKEKQSQILQEVDLISLEVFEIDTINGTKTSRVASLEVRADSIESEVFYQDELGQVQSRIVQQADLISSKVSQTDYNGVRIASLIEQSASLINITAEAIDLNGITHINGNVRIGDNLTSQKSLTFSDSQGIWNFGTLMNLQAMTLDLDASNINLNGIVKVNGTDVALANHTHSGYQPAGSYVADSGQGLYLSVNSNGTLTVSLANGKSATFIADSWTG